MMGDGLDLISCRSAVVVDDDDWCDIAFIVVSFLGWIWWRGFDIEVLIQC